MQKWEFLVLHPCKMQDSHKKWFLKSCEKYHCKIMRDLAPAKSNRTKGGVTTLKKGGRASLLGSHCFLKEQHPFSSTYWQYVPMYIYSLAFLAKSGLQDETQVSWEKSRTCLARSCSETKLYRLESARSNSSSCCAVSLAWGQKATQLYNCRYSLLVGIYWQVSSLQELCPMRNFLQTHLQEPGFFFDSQATLFSSDLSFSSTGSYASFSTIKPQVKVVPRKDFFTHLRSLANCTQSVSSWILRSDMTSWARAWRTLKNAREARWVICPDYCMAHPQHFCAVGDDSHWKIWHPSGLTLKCMPYGRGTMRNLLQRIL